MAFGKRSLTLPLVEHIKDALPRVKVATPNSMPSRIERSKSRIRSR